MFPVYQCQLSFIQATGTYQKNILRIHLIPLSVYIDQFLATHAHQSTQRHTVDISAGRSFIRIEIAVCIQPDDTEIIKTFSNPGGTPQPKWMIATDNQRESSSA